MRVLTGEQILVREGLAARFTQSAWAQLLEALEETEEGVALRLAGRLRPLPAREQ